MLFSGRTRWTDLSFRTQLFLALSLFTAIVTLTLTVALIAYERTTYQQQLRQEGNLLAGILAKELQLPLYAGHNEEVARLSAALLTYRSISAIRVRDGNGRIVVESSRTPTAWKPGALIASKTITTDNSSFSPEAQLLGEAPSAGEPTGNVELALNTLTIREELQHFVKMATIIALLFWLTLSAISYLVLQHLTRTVSLLLAGIDRIAAGDLESRLTVTDKSDMGRAATGINTLAETLQLKDAENHRLQLERVNSLRLEIDEEKTRHMAKLIQTNRMTSLGLLVSSMAHEINNPNGVSKLAGEYLAKVWKDAEPLLAELAASEGDFSLGGMNFSQAREEIGSALDSIARSSSRIERVVQNLRSYSLGDRDKLHRDVDLNRVANSALTIVRSHSRQNDVNISTRFDPELPRISGNPFQLEQVVTNLLLNALQALPAQGSRRVFLTTAWHRHDNSVSLEVRDEGHGIPEEHLPHLCEPFFSTRINLGGSGLGLYIANFIVSEHQGRLEFSSRPGSGCTVTMQLPVTRTEAKDCEGCINREE